MKIDPKYAFLHAFFLICVSCSFQNLSIWPKTYLFFPILHGFAPLNDVRAYIAWSWKTTLITWFFFTRMISNFKYKCPPGGGKGLLLSWFLYYITILFFPEVWTWHCISNPNIWCNQFQLTGKLHHKYTPCDTPQQSYEEKCNGEELWDADAQIGNHQVCHIFFFPRCWLWTLVTTE